VKTEKGGPDPKEDLFSVQFKFRYAKGRERERSRVHGKTSACKIEFALSEANTMLMVDG